MGSEEGDDHLHAARGRRYAVGRPFALFVIEQGMILGQEY